MNASTPAPAKAARHAFTLEDVLRLQDQGFFADPKRIALHEGDIVEMAADGDRHIALTMALNDAITLQLAGKGYFKGVQTTLRLSRTNAPSPDIYILAGGPPRGDVPTARVLLVIEVADTSLDDDLTDSAQRYARAGVGEFWVVDAKRRAIWVHRGPVDGRYPPPQAVPADAPATPQQIPDLTIVLDRDAPEA
ncbi:MAG: Uma2 family endonuclease [Hyphomonadaceae bacterium]|nr:Uma2 family endonuclease [Hyphomonadaceae bacterium]